jgi:septum formation protein
LSGQSNDVTTGVAIVRLADGVQLLGADTTKVFFRPYDQAAVAAYVATGDPLDKAGSYGIQSGAASLVDHIEGRYDTVVGFPTALVVQLLAEIGVTAQPVELTSPVPQVLPEQQHTAKIRLIT